MARRRVSRGAERLKTPSAGKVSACRGIFSFDTKREPEKCQRFRRAGATKKGLLAPFNPKAEGYTEKTEDSRLFGVKIF